MTGDRSATPLNKAAQDAAALKPACLHHLLEKLVAENGDRIAVSCNGLSLSYTELNNRANCLAAHLISAGVVPDQPVGLCLDRSPELLVGIFGILKAGGAYVPLDPAYPPDRLAHILDQAKPAIIVCRATLKLALPPSPAQRIDIDTLAAGHHENPDVAVSPDNLCYLIFTSGSTGTPKGVMVTHQNVRRLFSSIGTLMEFRADDVWTLFHSYAFGFSAWEIFGALLHGSRLVIVPDEIRGDPVALFGLLKAEKVSVFSQTPSAFRQLLLTDHFSNSDSELQLRLIVFSGEAVVTRDLQAWFNQHRDGPQVVNTYAITETGGQVAFRNYSDGHIDESKARNIGVALPDTSVHILDKQLQPVAPGTAGELGVGGPGLSRGYINQPELTAERFIEINISGQPERIYRTGDQALRLENGEIEFLGRTDNQVKLRGYRIELGDIEAALASHTGVTETTVLLRTDGNAEPRLVAYVVPRDARKPSVSELREHCEKSLPEYMIPAVYLYLDALPLNPNGKLDRAALPAPGKSRPQISTPLVAPGNELETALAKVWRDALSLDEIGVRDNFFELGGDSILALKLTASLRQLLGEYVYIVALLEAPTIVGLASYLRNTFPDAVAALGTRKTSDLQGEQLPVVAPDHAKRFETFPLTDIQQAYLVGRGNDFALGGVSTHLYIEVDAEKLDLQRLEKAWQKVIDRHPMLRAIVLPDGTQKILADVPPYQFPTQDLRDLDAPRVEEQLLKERDRLSHQVIPSDRWPLFELAASLLPNEQTRVHISLDCLITDARSFQIMSGELLKFYNDGNVNLLLPGLTFRDYVLTERQLRTTGFYDHALGYWKERAKTLPPMPQLPLARAPETLKEHHFVQRGYELCTADWDRFQARAAKAGITPTAALLQCFGETLAAWSRTPRLTLNLTLFNRMPLHPDVDNVVGDFTSLLLLGLDKLETGTFEQRAQRLQKELWQGVDNRFVSGIRVLREVAQLTGQVQTSMPVVFTSTLGIGADGQDSSSWHHLGKQVFSVSQTPQVWIDHVASERDGALWYTWDVVEDLFPAGMIDALFSAYSQRLQELADSESSWQLDWPTALAHSLPTEHVEILEAANATDAPTPAALLHAGFVSQAAKTPDAPAIISNDRTLSYAELDRLSSQIAHRLTEHGINTNELVAVVMQKGWEQIVAVLGILKAGAAYMPVDASMPAERLHYLLKFGEVRVAVTQICQDAAIDWPANVKRIRVSEDELANTPFTTIGIDTKLDDIAYVIFTSGSTGQPKGVVIDHRGAVNTCIDVNKRFRMSANDRVLALSSLSFDLSVYDIFGVLAVGGALVVPDASGMRDPAHWATLVARHQVTLWNTVPALMDLLTEYAEQQVEPVIQSLRTVMMSGDWIPVKLPDRIRAMCSADVFSLGGATEASIWSIIYPIQTVPKEWSSIPYGKAMLNQTFHVLNAELTHCPAWVQGELYIGGIGLAKGYWRDAEKTAASFITHPRTGERLYRTGDLGRYLPDGNIEFMGREDFQVKIQGFRVELGDIEAALESHPQVRNAVVIASGKTQGSKKLIAYFVPATSSAPDSVELRAWLGNKLPEYMVPSAFMQLDKLPLTANGKVDRRELPEVSAAETTLAKPKQSANKQVSGDIARLVGEVLQAEELDPHANLLQLGATSIEMIRIANALDQHLGFRPRMDDFYRDPSINGLSTLLEKQQPEQSSATQSTGGDPLLTPEWLLASIEKIMDPEERNRFKASRPGLRRFSDDETAIDLPGVIMDESAYRNHRSYRDFSASPVPAKNFSTLLSLLRSTQIDSKPKYLYASAGGLYPVQCYVYIKPDCVENISSGAYYHDPESHRLIALGQADESVRRLYDPLVNRPIFDQAAFALFLIADLNAIGAMYRERALHYSILEAGHITQLLEMRAPELGLGLCQTGGLETNDVRELLRLSEHHLVLHGLLGGGLPTPGTNSGSELPASDSSSERDEGEL